MKFAFYDHLTMGGVDRDLASQVAESLGSTFEPVAARDALTAHGVESADELIKGFFEGAEVDLSALEQGMQSLLSDLRKGDDYDDDLKKDNGEYDDEEEEEEDDMGDEITKGMLFGAYDDDDFEDFEGDDLEKGGDLELLTIGMYDDLGSLRKSFASARAADKRGRGVLVDALERLTAAVGGVDARIDRLEKSMGIPTAPKSVIAGVEAVNPPFMNGTRSKTEVLSKARQIMTTGEAGRARNMIDAIGLLDANVDPAEVARKYNIV